MTRMSLDEQIAFLAELKANPDAEVECMPSWNHPSDWVIATHLKANPDCFNFADFRYRIHPKLKTIWVNEYENYGDAFFSEDESRRRVSVFGENPRTAVRYVECPEGYEVRRIAND